MRRVFSPRSLRLRGNAPSDRFCRKPVYLDSGSIAESKGMAELDAYEAKAVASDSAKQAGSADHKLQFLAVILALAGCAALAISPLVMLADRAISAAVRAGHVPGDLRKAIELSEAFAHGSGVAVILIALLLVCSRPRASIWTVISMTALSGVTANVLKGVFTRARPYTYDAEARAVTDVTGWEFLGTGSFWDASQRSFPSGHTATAWGLAIGLSLLFPRGRILFLLLAILATYQRLYSGAHFPSDTVAGFGIACLSCSIVLFVPRLRKSLLVASPATSVSAH